MSTSVICPAFISQAGMFADIQAAHGVKAPWILGTCTPEAVARALVRAVDRDQPESFVAERPVGLFFAIGLLFPRILEQLTLLFGVNDMFLQAAKSARQKAELKRSEPQLQRDASGPQ